METLNPSLQTLYAQHQGKVSDKWSSYLSLYEAILGPLRQSVQSLLEIGVQNGGSLELWAKYFPHAQCIVGCDIDPKCANLRYDDPRIRVVVNDATQSSTRTQIERLSPTFDVVIEDGSHIPREVIAAFLRYWPMVKPGGIFIAEDLHCDYFPGHEGGVAKRNIANRFFAELVHVINLEHWVGVTTIAQLLHEFAPADLVDQAKLAGTIASVSFHNSVAIVRKADSETSATLGNRAVVGTVAMVEDAVLRLQDKSVTSLFGLHEPVRSVPASTSTSFSGLFAKR